MAKLQVDSVRKRFGERTVLSDVFLSCQTGEIIGLFGRNGSGKSTLLKIIFGSLKAEGRFVKIGEQPYKNLWSTREVISYLPQHHFLPSQLSIKALVELLCRPSQTEFLVQFDWLRPFLHQKSRQLSVGERRLVELLLILHSDARFLLLDEPFKGLAPLHKELVSTWIKDQAQDKGIILTDHDYQSVLAMTTRLILLEQGRLRSINTEQDLVDGGYLPG